MTQSWTDKGPLGRHVEPNKRQVRAECVLGGCSRSSFDWSTCDLHQGGLGEQLGESRSAGTKNAPAMQQ